MNAGGGISTDNDDDVDDRRDTLTTLHAGLSYGEATLTDELMTAAGLSVTGVLLTMSCVGVGTVALCAVGHDTSQLRTCCRTTVGGRLVRSVTVRLHRPTDDDDTESTGEVA